MEIIWTRSARLTYIEVLENLKKRWTKREMKNFNNLTNQLLEKIKNKQVTHPFANDKIGIRKGIVHKNVSLFYQEDRVNNKIYLVTFFKS
ncbi:hypothetical protein TMP248_320012 [Tenacibaculum maritimum]|uniref:hypothetical protein n=1 Tax=Tenacibaculum maritimum TaxID=107401 RepID=UPI0012E5EF7A|nr:hypothetical protein [Tenacibaculum maritimum]CAA0222766.1 hypothetical protein TMP248_320012 [Tenacibaculum maritimum]CAA0240690.1 hypothetical protein FS0810_50145 [Tenacibaculum maritimum]